MVARCGSCHRLHVVRLVVLEFSLPTGGLRHCEVRLCGRCTAALLDSIEVLHIGVQKELPNAWLPSMQYGDSA
jgi:hypothetical protein